MNRRDFIKFIGVSITAACVPGLIQREEPQKTYRHRQMDHSVEHGDYSTICLIEFDSCGTRKPIITCTRQEYDAIRMLPYPEALNAVKGMVKTNASSKNL